MATDNSPIQYQAPAGRTSSENTSTEHGSLDMVKDRSDAHDLPMPAPAFVAPDGGLKAWGAVVGGFLCQFCSFGFLNVLGIFQTQYEHVNLPTYSSSAISWIFTFQLFLIFFLSQINGIAVDMFGPRAVIIPAAAFEIFGLGMLSLSKEYYQIFLAQGVCFGIGAAGLFMPGLIVAGQNFNRRRGLAVGIVASGGSLGGVVFPFVLNRLFQQVGFAAAVRWTTLILGVLLILAIALTSSPMKPKGWRQGRRSLASLKVFTRLDFLLYVSGGFAFFWGLFAPFDYLPLFAYSQTSPDLALYTIAIINAASIFGRIVPAHFADRYGYLKVMTIMAYLTAICVFVIWLPISFHHSVAGIIIFSIFFGFTSGAFVSLLTPCMVELCGGKIGDLGVMLGTFMGINSFACLTGLPIQGAIADHSQGSFTGLISFAGATMLIGAILINVAWYVRTVEARRAIGSEK